MAKGRKNSSGSVTEAGAVLMVDGILYPTAPDHVWALMHATAVNSGTTTGKQGRDAYRNRGVGIWRNYLFFETPDNFLVSLDLKTGKERWHVEIADFDQQYFSTMAPMIIGDHVIVGTGNDLDAPDTSQSHTRKPETGMEVLHVPMNPGDPGE